MLILKIFCLFTALISALPLNAAINPHGAGGPNTVKLPKIIKPDFDIYDYSLTPKEGLINWNIGGKYNSTGRNFSANIAIFPAAKFSFYPADKDGCIEARTTSEVAKIFDCSYATNGAFFNFENDTTFFVEGSICLGNLISDSHPWLIPKDGSGLKRVNFGLTEDGKAVVGFISKSRGGSQKGILGAPEHS